MKFLQTNRWKKRGMALVPMQYPFGFWGNHPAIVTIYQIDGSIAISHGGIEMGQGMNTKVKNFLDTSCFHFTIKFLAGCSSGCPYSWSAPRNNFHKAQQQPEQSECHRYRRQSWFRGSQLCKKYIIKYLSSSRGISF